MRKEVVLLSRNEFICDCNIIHEAIVNQTKKKMLDNDFINEIVEQYINKKD